MDKEQFKPVVYDHEATLQRELADTDFKAEYDALDDEFALLHLFLQARKTSQKTQEEVAELMHTSRSTIARIEACGNSQRHSPSLNTLRRYAKALGYRLKIELEPLSAN